MPQWWRDQKAFVGSIMESTRYFEALNVSLNETGQRFDIFENENTIQILKPFNGQMLVSFTSIQITFHFFASVSFETFLADFNLIQ